ncbi:Endonuclease/exonuclease/phosphatase [Endogone sp. FLAS-F59071]|nr:Endonuclease/exonuclease/phosphatase [Endogone sp. FLAS-F59071]|eukprot:RUS12791.1 Endonuclease/exonuclease/phosphatase [Endogone sp. FLAS-F59071]
MRILTWNINGIRTVLQYYPWSKTKSYKVELHFIELILLGNHHPISWNLSVLLSVGRCLIQYMPNLIHHRPNHSFQETKITRSKLGPDVAMIPGYDAYFSFTRVKQGYSGVVTYVRHPLTPLAAEEGITGVLHRSSPNDETPGPIGHYPSLSVSDAQILDSEGRCVILDFGFFVLFNVYFPHLSGPDRESFKSLFNSVLQCRVEALLDAGREVIVAGDVNVCHREIDHCDPRQSCKDNELQEFGDQPARKWLDTFLAPNGRMVDMCRKFWPERKGMFTCKLG